MTDHSYILTEIWISLTIMILAGVFVISRQRAEDCRTKLRIVRDCLFDAMWKNNYDFSAIEYQNTRQLINGLMRLTSTVGPISFIVLLVRAANNSKRQGIVDAMPNGELKSILEHAARASVEIYLRFLFLEGFLGIAIKIVYRTFTMAAAIRAKSELLLIEMAREFGTPSLSRTQLAVLQVPSSLMLRTYAQPWRSR